MKRSKVRKLKPRTPIPVRRMTTVMFRDRRLRRQDQRLRKEMEEE